MARAAWSNLKTSDIIAGQQIFAGDWLTRVSNLNTFLSAIQSNYISKDDPAAQSIDSDLTLNGAVTIGGVNAGTILTTEHDSDGTHGAITPTSVSCEGEIRARGFLTLQPTGDPELTISSGAVTATGSYHRVDTEGDAAADDLDIINTSATAGSLLLLRSEYNDRVVTIRDMGVAGGSANIQLAGSMPFVLDSSLDCILLYYGGSRWIEISRSDNG